MNETEMNIQGTETLNEADGTHSERTFTQEEVDRIVSERLARDRKTRLPEAETEAQKRLSELNAKESRLNCKEFLLNNNYPAEIIDILDTSDIDKFKENAEKIYEVMSRPNNRRTHATPFYNPEAVYSNPLDEAFGRDVKHQPKVKGYSSFR